MRKRATALFALVVVLVAAFASVALASTTTTATIVKYDAKVKVLRAKTAGVIHAYKVVSSTICGYSKGQSGGRIACKTLGAAKYKGKRATITWKRHSGRQAIKIVIRL